MFKLFKRKSELEKLEIEYRKLLEQSYKLSKTNRRESDSKVAEAEKLLEQILVLKNK